MDFIKNITSQAKKLQKTIVLPEADDKRILKAAEIINLTKIAKIILIGEERKIRSIADEDQIDLSPIKIIDPRKTDYLSDFANKYKIKREKKGMSYDKAMEILSEDYLFFGAMMVDQDLADGMVAGTTHFTSETIKATVHCIGTAPENKLISSFFVMITPKHEFGVNGMLFFADCGVIPNPDPEELSEIAITTASSFIKLIGEEPKVAMLSFSTKTSAVHGDVDKVIKATEIARSKRPDFLIDGELQVDAALIPQIGQRKAPNSMVAGKANILIFPDLDAGNIGYKLVERIGGATALGPIFQGCRKPVNDLSRGCSVDDVINVTAITAVQSQ
jgi:phosphate acetyltransferase